MKLVNIIIIFNSLISVAGVVVVLEVVVVVVFGVAVVEDIFRVRSCFDFPKIKYFQNVKSKVNYL